MQNELTPRSFPSRGIRGINKEFWFRKKDYWVCNGATQSNKAGSEPYEVPYREKGRCLEILFLVKALRLQGFS